MKRAKKQRFTSISLDDKTREQLTALNALGYNLSKLIRMLVNDAYIKMTDTKEVNNDN